MRQVRLVSYNTWLIPFKGPMFLSRGAERCAPALVAAVRDLEPEPVASQGGAAVLRLALVQEGWAFRVGVAWPLFWLLGCMEGALLRHGIVRGGQEPWAVAAIKGVLLGAMVVVNLLLQGWVPLLRNVLWDPKPQMAAALKRAGLPFETSGVYFFRSLSQWRRGSLQPALMDSGLLTCSSHAPDASGFVPWDAKGNSEAAAVKGMLWARWGDPVPDPVSL